jgi:hypothetical protein
MTADRYARLAQQHMATWLPARYRQIDDPDAYFTRLGEEIATQVEALETTLAATEPASEDYVVRVGQLRAARIQAEEIVLADLVWLPPENPEHQTESDLDGWINPAEQEEDWETQMWGQGLDPATGQPMFTDAEIEQKAIVAAARRRTRQDPPTGTPITGPSAKTTWPPPGR